MTSDNFPVKDLESLLKRSLSAKIKSLTWKHLTKPGENFGSRIFSVTLTLSCEPSKTLDLVVKLPPNSSYLLDLFESPLSFKKELLSYRDMLPAFAELQPSRAGYEPFALSPRFYGGRTGLRGTDEFDEQAAIVLDNLKTAGYECGDRLSGLERDQVILAVRSLAIFHATAVALKLRKPDAFEKWVVPALTPFVSEASLNCMLDMLNQACENLAETPDGQRLADRIKRSVAAKQRDAPEEPWATVLHNDFWTNNMMFRRRAGELVDMKIVDFQLCMYDYGMLDLVFFLVSSPRQEIVDNNIDEMIDLYYESFVERLGIFDVDASLFPKKRFDELVKLCASRVFAKCIMMVQVVKSDPEHVARMEDISDKETFLQMSRSTMVKEKLVHTMRTFEKMGWLL